jgi:replicative DNA helicase
LAVIDYLQLLDQKRENPELMAQVRALKSFARQRGLILVFISQIDRSYDPSDKRCPDISDIRLPNPLDLSLFDKTCFLHDGEVRFQSVN